MNSEKTAPAQPERCDIYDILGRSTGRVCLRSDPLATGDFVLGSTVWIYDGEKGFLMQQRAKTKRIRPLRWAAHGGGALAGESSADAAIREVQEELGLTLIPEKLEFLGRQIAAEGWINDYYIYREPVDTSALTLQEEEVAAVCWMSFEEILRRHRSGELIPFVPEVPMLAEAIGYPC